MWIKVTLHQKNGYGHKQVLFINLSKYAIAKDLKQFLMYYKINDVIIDNVEMIY